MARTARFLSSLRPALIAAALGLGIPLVPGLAAAQDCLADVSTTGDGFRNFSPSSCRGLVVRISIPERCAENGDECGLITALDGLTVTNEITARNDDLERIGREQGFVVLRAQGPISPLLGVGGAPALRPQDTNNIIELMQEARSKLAIDPDRLHIAGFSQGAGVALQIACRRPDMIASVAAIAPAGAVPGCGTTGLPVRGVFFTQSSRDQLVPAPLTRTTVNALVRGMGLTEDDGRVIERGAQGATITRFTSPEGDVLEFFEHNFGGATFGDGHCYPGSFEGPQRLANVTMAELVRLAGMGLTNADVDDDFQFGCDDDDVIRIGERMARFFEDNLRR
jgi:predicted esterase